jgi:lipid-binding SYLF domain-containing protein
MRKSFLPVLAVLLGLISNVIFSPGLGAGPFRKDADDLDARIRDTTDRFIESQNDAQTRIPATLLARAQGIIFIQKIKAGIGIGGEAGGGVALVRDPTTGRWSPPAFVASAEASWGIQLGAQKTNITFVLMNEKGLNLLKDGALNVGVDVQATAGPVGVGGDLDTTTIRDPVLVYTNSKGLFAGAAFKGGGVVPSKKNNATYYGLTLKEILFGDKAKLTSAGRELIRTIQTASGEAPGDDVIR